MTGSGYFQKVKWLGRPQSESWFAGGIGNNQCKQKDGHGWHGSQKELR